MLAENLHHPSVRGQLFVIRAHLFHPGAAGNVEHFAEPVGGRFIRPKQAEIVFIAFKDGAQILAQHLGGLHLFFTGRRDIHGELADVGRIQLAAQASAVGIGRSAHPLLTLRRQRAQLRSQSALLVEQRLRLIAAHPLFQNLTVAVIFATGGDRHLMRAPEILDFFAVDGFWTGPAFRAAQNNHRPARDDVRRLAATGALLIIADLVEGAVQRVGHQAVHFFRLVAANEQRLIAVAAEQLMQILVAAASQQRRVGDFIAVEVQDRQYRAVARGVQELGAVPAGRERAGFRLAVADDAGGDQIGVIKHRAERVRKRVAQFAAFVNRSGRFRRGVAGNAAGERELPEQPLHPGGVFADVRVDLAVAALQPGVGHHAGAAMPRTADIDHIEVAVADNAVQVSIDKVQTGRGAPVAQQARFNMFGL